ncbi:MAG: hypothetical protein MK179_15410 [Pirellulaceae bacterium]|nr:hypothetical protein [Pirellulaceae bacterium]
MSVQPWESTSSGGGPASGWHAVLHRDIRHPDSAEQCAWQTWLMATMVVMKNCQQVVSQGNQERFLRHHHIRFCAPAHSSQTATMDEMRLGNRANHGGTWMADARQTAAIYD